jgi:hypothetical protein
MFSLRNRVFVEVSFERLKEKKEEYNDFWIVKLQLFWNIEGRDNIHNNIVIHKTMK